MTLHVYGVVRADAPPPTEVTGIDGARIDLVTFGGLGALTSPAAGPPRPSRTALQAHAAVLEAYLGRGVVPMRFGHQAEDEDAVTDGVLRPHATELERLLDDLGGAVEVTVKVSYVEHAILREILASDPEVARLQSRLAGGGAHGDRIRLGEAVAAALEERRRQDAVAVLARLRPAARGIREHETRGHPQVSWLSVLTDADHLTVLDEALDALASASDGRMEVSAVGPLPPYSFVELADAATA